MSEAFRGHNLVFRFLDTNGDGSGTKNANGNYSVTPETFYIQPPAGEKFEIYRMILTIEDSGSIDASAYGNGITLTNGVEFAVYDGDDVLKLDLLDGDPIITNGDWARIMYDINITNFGVGNQYLNGRFTIRNAGAALLLDGKLGDRLEIKLNDDFSGLVKHYFFVEGYKY